MNLKNATMEDLKKELEMRKIEEDMKKKEIKLKKQLSFSERLITLILLMCGGSIFLGILYSFRYQSDLVMDRALVVVGGILATSIGFFIWKAKSENMIKIKNNPNFDLEDYANDIVNEIMEDL